MVGRTASVISPFYSLLPGVVFTNELSGIEIVLYHHFNNRQCIYIYADHTKTCFFLEVKIKTPVSWLKNTFTSKCYEGSIVLQSISTIP